MKQQFFGVSRSELQEIISRFIDRLDIVLFSVEKNEDFNLYVVGEETALSNRLNIQNHGRAEGGGGRDDRLVSIFPHSRSEPPVDGRSPSLESRDDGCYILHRDGKVIIIPPTSGDGE